MFTNVHEAFVEVCCDWHAQPVLSVPFLCDLHETVTHGLPGNVRTGPESVTGSTRGPLYVLAEEAQEIENASRACSTFLTTTDGLPA